MLSCLESSELDRSTIARASIPALLLMEDAAIGLWKALEPIARRRGAGSEGLLLAVCGPGNNGGDGLALLRQARFAGLENLCAIVSRPGLSEESASFALSLRSLGVPILAWNDEREKCERTIARAALIVDGLAGTGLKGPLRGEPLALSEAAMSSKVPIASIDLPSGLSDRWESGFPLVQAAWTLAIEPRKACLYYPAARQACGEILGIGGVFPADEEESRPAGTSLLEKDDLRVLAPLPPDSAYKGDRGRVAVFAGSLGTSGAAVLASRACLGAGAGLAALYASRDILPLVAPMLDAVMVKPEPAPGDFAADRWDCLLIGPGWGKSPERRELLEGLLRTGLPAVLDADAIALYRDLAASGFVPSAPVLLTPHPGEFAALTGRRADEVLADPPSLLRAAAETFRAVIALKSQVTWIVSPEGGAAVWDGRECGLGTAGSGDVLAGLAAGLLARASARRDRAVPPRERAGASLADAFDAAQAAVLAHGLAGREARLELGWFEASALPRAAARILGGRESRG
jgi:NAD(P)H-hydrate epimerase